MKILRNALMSTALATAGFTGAATTASAQECFIGEVRMFAGNFAPRGWALTDGQLLPISQNSALFSILGTTYGGDGRTTFALPDMRSRTAVGPRQGPGLSNHNLGARFGTETNNQVPAHTHSATTTATLNANTTNGTSPLAANNVLANGGAARIYGPPGSTSAMASGAVTATTTVNSAGVGSVNNIQPSLAINHVICLQGIFPSRN